MASHSQTNSTSRLSAYLWDLRAQAEAKLRCLTRLQRTLDDYCRAAQHTQTPKQRTDILTDVKDLVTISSNLQALSAEALEAAHALA
jgi:hypothetical protein